MKTKAEILNTDFVMIQAESSPTGVPFVLAVEGGIPQKDPVITENAVAPGFYNLLAASRIMFGALDNQAVWLQKLLDLCDATGVPHDSDLPQTLVQMQNAILLAQQCAVDGLDTTAHRIVKSGL